MGQGTRLGVPLMARSSVLGQRVALRLDELPEFLHARKILEILEAKMDQKVTRCFCIESDDR